MIQEVLEDRQPSIAVGLNQQQQQKELNSNGNGYHKNKDKINNKQQKQQQNTTLNNSNVDSSFPVSFIPSATTTPTSLLPSPKMNLDNNNLFKTNNGVINNNNNNNDTSTTSTTSTTTTTTNKNNTNNKDLIKQKLDQFEEDYSYFDDTETESEDSDIDNKIDLELWRRDYNDLRWRCQWLNLQIKDLQYNNYVCNQTYKKIRRTKQKVIRVDNPPTYTVEQGDEDADDESNTEGDDTLSHSLRTASMKTPTKPRKLLRKPIPKITRKQLKKDVVNHPLYTIDNSYYNNDICHPGDGLSKPEKQYNKPKKINIDEDERFQYYDKGDFVDIESLDRMEIDEEVVEKKSNKDGRSVDSRALVVAPSPGDTTSTTTTTNSCPSTSIIDAPSSTSSNSSSSTTNKTPTKRKQKQQITNPPNQQQNNLNHPISIITPLPTVINNHIDKIVKSSPLKASKKSPQKQQDYKPLSVHKKGKSNKKIPPESPTTPTVQLFYENGKDHHHHNNHRHQFIDNQELYDHQINELNIDDDLSSCSSSDDSLVSYYPYDLSDREIDDDSDHCCTSPDSSPSSDEEQANGMHFTPSSSTPATPNKRSKSHQQKSTRRNSTTPTHTSTTMATRRTPQKKDDIDDVIIPIGPNFTIPVVQYKEIVTPEWREVTSNTTKRSVDMTMPSPLLLAGSGLNNNTHNNHQPPPHSLVQSPTTPSATIPLLQHQQQSPTPTKSVLTSPSLGSSDHHLEETTFIHINDGIVIPDPSTTSSDTYVSSDPVSKFSQVVDYDPHHHNNHHQHGTSDSSDEDTSDEFYALQHAPSEIDEKKRYFSFVESGKKKNQQKEFHLSVNDLLPSYRLFRKKDIKLLGHTWNGNPEKISKKAAMKAKHRRAVESDGTDEEEEDHDSKHRQSNKRRSLTSTSPSLTKSMLSMSSLAPLKDSKRLSRSSSAVMTSSGGSKSSKKGKKKRSYDDYDDDDDSDGYTRHYRPRNRDRDSLHRSSSWLFDSSFVWEPVQSTNSTPTTTITSDETNNNNNNLQIVPQQSTNKLVIRFKRTKSEEYYSRQHNNNSIEESHNSPNTDISIRLDENDSTGTINNSDENNNNNSSSILDKSNFTTDIVNNDQLTTTHSTTTTT